MGEARRKRLAVMTDRHPMLPEPSRPAPVPQFVEYRTLKVPKVIDDAIKFEMEKFNEAHDQKFVSRRDYMIALLAAAVAREERLRDEREAANRLIVPAGMNLGEIERRLEAAKRGK